LDIIGEENACFGLFFASLLIIANNWFKKNYIFRKEKIIVHSQNGLMEARKLQLEPINQYSIDEVNLIICIYL
jgi:hypothetical protein